MAGRRAARAGEGEATLCGQATVLAARDQRGKGRRHAQVSPSRVRATSGTRAAGRTTCVVVDERLGAPESGRSRLELFGALVRRPSSSRHVDRKDVVRAHTDDVRGDCWQLPAGRPCHHRALREDDDQSETGLRRRREATRTFNVSPRCDALRRRRDRVQHAQESQPSGKGARALRTV